MFSGIWRSCSALLAREVRICWAASNSSGETDLQVGQLLGAAFPTPQDARISEITDNATDTGVVPHLTRSCPVALFVQVGGNPLSAEALMHILVKMIRTTAASVSLTTRS